MSGAEAAEASKPMASSLERDEMGMVCPFQTRTLTHLDAAANDTT